MEERAAEEHVVPDEEDENEEEKVEQPQEEEEQENEGNENERGLSIYCTFIVHLLCIYYLFVNVQKIPRRRRLSLKGEGIGEYEQEPEKVWDILIRIRGIHRCIIRKYKFDRLVAC